MLGKGREDDAGNCRGAGKEGEKVRNQAPRRRVPLLQPLEIEREEALQLGIASVDSINGLDDADWGLGK